MLFHRAQQRQAAPASAHLWHGAWRLKSRLRALRATPISCRGHRNRLPLLALLAGLCLALQGCAGLPGQSGHFQPVPSTTRGDGGTPLAVNQDGRFKGHIAFIRNHQLYIFDGKTDSTHVVSAGANVQDPAYSPDGKRLAYISRGTAWSDVMVMPASGGTPTALTHNQGTGQQITCPSGISESDNVWAAGPVWAADGASLYYLSDQQKLSMACGFVDMAVWKIAAQGGTPQLVLWPARGKDNAGAPGAGGDANLALRPGVPDELAYTRYAYDQQQGDSKLIQLFMATLSDQQETALSPATVDTTPEQALEPAWSPDGQYLAYIRRGSDSDDLYVIHVSNPANGAPHFADYATATKLLSGPIAYPVWSPDGKSLLYLAFKDNEYNLYLAQLSISGSGISLQGSAIQLTQGGVDGDSRPSWTAA
jgi:Tol biopolymer transport system component